MIKRKRIISICTIIILLIAYFLPYEKWFIRFNTLEKAWNTAGNKEEIISKETVDNITFIVCKGKDNSILDSYIAKDNKGWIPQLNRLFNSRDYIFTDNNYWIMTWYDYKKNIITISSAFFENENQKVIVIKDNINTNFKHVRIKYNNEYIDKWYALIDNLPKDYSIIIDGKECKL